MDYRIKEIKEKVFAENQARLIIKDVVPKIIEKLKPYTEKDTKEGVIKKLQDKPFIKPILKQDFTLMKKIAEEINPLLDKDAPIEPLKAGDTARLNYIYLYTNQYDIHLKFSLYFSGEDYNFYYESYKYIASISNREIEKFFNLAEQDTKPLNEDEEISLYNQAKEKKQELDNIKDKMFYSFRSFI